MSQLQPIVGSRGAVMATRVILWVFLVLSVVIGAASLVVGGAALVRTITSGQYWITLVADKNLPHLTQQGHATILSGTYETASILATGLSGWTTAVALISGVATILTQVALCATVAVLAWRLLHGRLFRRSLTVGLTVSGGILMIGGMIAQLSAAIGGAMAAVDLNGPSTRGFWPLAGRFDPTLVVFGVVLLLVGLAFEHGERIARETEGLV